jgi:hypothetical protein
VNNDVGVEVTVTDGVTTGEVELLLAIDIGEIVVEPLLTDVGWLVVVVMPVGAIVIGMASQGLQTAPFHPL